ncbi:MAG: class I adenylate-forming enzyme family protein, partial [Acidimicrobiia bacterium]
LMAAGGAGVASVREVIGLADDDRSLTGLLLDDLRGEPMDVAPIAPESPAILGFTSGTTGRPKCAPLSHRNLLASIRGVMWAWRWTEAEHLVHSLPISHQHGLGGIHATLLAGSRATVFERFDAESILATIEQGATAMFAVPSIHESLLRDLGDRASGLGRLRVATSGSAPLPADLALRVEQITGQLPLERYGSTEAGLDISNPLLGRRISGTVGLALPGVEAAMVDDAGDPVPPGEPGEILIRGPQVFSGYRGIEPADTFLFDWFRTGDIGIVDPETGYLSIVGRSKELIISGGMNVYPREVEAVLRTGPGVEDAAVIGFPSQRWGEEVVAFVAPAVAPVGLIAELAAGALAPYKRPKRILAVDVIPRTSTGKVNTTALLKMASG